MTLLIVIVSVPLHAKHLLNGILSYTFQLYNTALQRPFFSVSAAGPYIDSYFNLPNSKGH